MRLQSGLCTGQCDVWHSLEQYQVLQRVHPLVAGAAQEAKFVALWILGVGCARIGRWR